MKVLLLQKMFKSLLFISLVITLFSGCTNVVFQPDKTTYKSPSDYNLNYENIMFKNKDIMLHAWWIKPHNKSRGLILAVHGNAQNISAQFLGWNWLVKAGYEVFIFDYRGYGQSQGRLDLVGAISDVSCAMDYVEAHYKKPYILNGQSLGGTLALNALAKKARPQISLAIIDSTYADLEAMGVEVMQRSVITWPFSWLAYPLLDGDYNGIDVVADIQTPLLFVAGSKDNVIGANNSWQLFDAATPPKEFWLDVNAGHINTFENPKMQKVLLNFLKDPHFSNDYDAMKIYR